MDPVAESTCSRHALRECDMALESSLRGLQLPTFGSVGCTFTLSPKWGCDMTPLFQPSYCVVSQWCAHFSFVLLLLRSYLHRDGWTYSTSFWCTSRLNFPSYNMPLVLRTYTHDYSYTPNNYFIWTHVATPLWPSVRMKLTLPKLGIWSPSGLPNV